MKLNNNISTYWKKTKQEEYISANQISNFTVPQTPKSLSRVGSLRIDPQSVQ